MKKLIIILFSLLPSILLASWNSEGRILQKEGKYKEAIKCYEKAIKECPKDVDSYNRIGVCYYTLGDWDNALKLNRKTVALFPDNLIVTYNYVVLMAIISDKASNEYYARKISEKEYRTTLEEGIIACNLFIAATEKKPKGHKWMWYNAVTKEQQPMDECADCATLMKYNIETWLITLEVFKN